MVGAAMVTHLGARQFFWVINGGTTLVPEKPCENRLLACL